MDDGAAESAGDGEGEASTTGQQRRSSEKKIQPACDHCKRGKMRCIGKENPPCRKSMTRTTSFLESRVHEMETQIQAVQSSVDRLAAALLSNLAAPAQPYTFPEPPYAEVARVPDPTVTPGQDSLFSGPSPAIASSIMAPPVVVAPTRHQPEVETSHDSQISVRWQDDEDPLQAGATSAPFREMLSRAAAVSDVGRHHGPSPRQSKRRRTDDSSSSQDPESADDAERDPVSAGLCTETEGRRLFDIFLRHSHDFVPVFDPICDTWESLRGRSPFAITVMIMAAKMADDCDGPVSKLQQQCRARAENMATRSLFSSTSNLETLQATMILSCWSEHAWRPGVHALSLAMDLGIHRCLPKLATEDEAHNDDQFATMRLRVAGARCWLALLKMRLEMAYNLGLPLLSYEDDQLVHARAFLRNPMTNLGDCRLVSACELLALRIPLHRPPGAETQDSAALDDTIRSIHRKTYEWEAYWHSHYASRGVPQSHVLRELLTSEVSHALLHTNIKVVFGLRSPEDVALQSAERQEWLLGALQAAQRQVDLCLHRGFRDTFRYANSYTFVSMAFTARCLIRLATLCSISIDARRISRDVSDMADLLNKAPGFAYGQLLRIVLDKARAAQILPPPTRASSPLSRPGTVADSSEAANGPPVPGLPDLDPLAGDMSLNWAEYFLSGSYAQDESAMDFVFNMTETYGSDPMAALLSFPPLNSDFVLEGSASSGQLG